jgi:hypothetical protein
MGKKRHPKASRLMIAADGGGSNGYRVRLWKVELQSLADELKFSITVCHLPPGTSKWNKIEHRLLSFITINWRGKPLLSYRTIVQLIAATTTDTGLKVRAVLDENKYPKGVKVSAAQLPPLASPATRSMETGTTRSRQTENLTSPKVELTELFMDEPLFERVCTPPERIDGRRDLREHTVMHLVWGHEADAGMVVLLVVPEKKGRQKAFASSMQPKRWGNSGRYFRVLNWLSENGLSLDV